MAVKFIQPNDILAPYIDRYWFFDHNDIETSLMPQIPPGVGLDLFIHYAEPFSMKNGQILPQSHIIFSGQNSTPVLPSEHIRFIAIRFRAGALKNFTDIPLCQLLDTYATTENIWGTSGKQVATRIRSIEEKGATISQLEFFLEEKLSKHRKDTPGWNLTVDKLYRHYDSFTIDRLSKKMAVSNRHFRRKFIEETGLSPKHFQQLARFHATLKPLLVNKEKTYLSTALDKGYFDQNHFIKEFKCFMDCTPSDFLQDKNFMSHFYYPSLNRQGSFAIK